MYAKICKNRPITLAYTHSCWVWSCTRTDRRTKFLLQILIPRGPKRRQKKFQLDQKKIDIDPNAIYVRGQSLSGHIEIYQNRWWVSKYYAAWLTFGGKCLVQLLTVNRALCNIDHIAREKREGKAEVMWLKNVTETMYAICELNFDVNSGYREFNTHFLECVALKCNKPFTHSI